MLYDETHKSVHIPQSINPNLGKGSQNTSKEAKGKNYTLKDRYLQENLGNVQGWGHINLRRVYKIKYHNFKGGKGRLCRNIFKLFMISEKQRP